MMAMVNIVALLFAAASSSYEINTVPALGFVGGAFSPESMGEIVNLGSRLTTVKVVPVEYIC